MCDWLVGHYDVLKDFAGPLVAYLSLIVTAMFAVFGFRTFGRWKREQVEGRRIEVAIEALNLAYKSKHIFDNMRSPLVEGYEWADMPTVSGDSDDKRSRRGSLYAIGKRVQAHKEFFEAVWACHSKCMAVFGPHVEDVFLELHKARRHIEVAVQMLIMHLDDAPMRPDPQAGLWQQLRVDLCAAEGETEGDRVGRRLDAFRTGIETMCRPIIDRTYGRNKQKK